MVYSFARVGAALAMRVEDVFVQNRRLWVRLQEGGGKRHEMPCRHNLEEYLSAYLDGCTLRKDRKGPLFRTIARGTKRLSDTPLPQANAFQMVRRRAFSHLRRRSPTKESAVRIVCENSLTRGGEVCITRPAILIDLLCARGATIEVLLTET